MTARALSALVLAATLGAAGTAGAQDIKDLTRLLEEPVVSTVSKKAEGASVAPATVTVITSEQLRRYGIHTIAEALNFLSLGMIAQSYAEPPDVGARGVVIAGDYGDHFLLLLNGHAMNETWAGAAYVDRGAAIPLEIVDHIEVILGPGSVLYGSNAMAAVVNVVTKSARDFAGFHAVVESELPISIRAAVGVGKEFTIRGKPAEVTAVAEYYASKGPSFGLGPQAGLVDPVTNAPQRFNFAGTVTGTWQGDAANTLFSQVPSIFARFTVGDFEVFARGAIFKRWSPYCNSVGLGACGWDVTDPGYEQDRWVEVDARYHTRVSPIAQVSARLYGDAYDYTERQPIPAPSGCPAGLNDGCYFYERGTAQQVGTELQASFDWFHDGRLGTLFGVDGRLRVVGQDFQEYVDHATGGLAGVSPNYGAFEQALGAYVEQTARIAKRLSFNVGARVDADSRFGAHVSPRVAGNVTTWDGGSFRLSYSEAFRAPSAFERYNGNPLNWVANPNLRPETVRSIEGAFEQRIGTHRFMVGIFRSWWSDLVEAETLGAGQVAALIAQGQLLPAATTQAVVQFFNAQNVDNYGAELAFEGSSLRQRLRYGLNATGAFTRSNEGSGSTPAQLPGAAQLFGNARISYDFGAPFPALALVGRLVGTAPVVNSTYTPTPTGPVLAELRAAVSGPFPFVPHLSYRASANYASASGSPYAAGPVPAATPQNPTQQLAPIDRFRVTVGLAYDLPF